MNTLLIDDDPIVQLLVGKMLETKGVNVTGLKSWEEIEHFINSHSENDKIDLILLDLQIGDINGVEVFGKLKEKINPFPTVLYMSSHTKEEATQMFPLENDISNYIQKPFQSSALYQKLASIGINISQ